MAQSGALSKAITAVGIGTAIASVAAFCTGGAATVLAAIGGNIASDWLNKLTELERTEKLAAYLRAAPLLPLNHDVERVLGEAAIASINSAIALFAETAPANAAKESFGIDLRQRAATLTPELLGLERLDQASTLRAIAGSVGTEAGAAVPSLAPELPALIHELLVPKGDRPVFADWQAQADTFLAFLREHFAAILTLHVTEALKQDDRFFKIVLLTLVANLGAEIEQLGQLHQKIDDLKATWSKSQITPDELHQVMAHFAGRIIERIDRVEALIKAGSAPQRRLRRRESADPDSVVYWDRSAALIGRDAALAALDRFLDAPEPVLWTVVTGPAGIGKTRLVHETLLLREDTLLAETGFLQEPGKDQWLTLGGYKRWDAPRDTILVIDYAGLVDEHIRGLLDDLTSRPSGRGLGGKVRLILIDTLPYGSEFGVRQRVTKGEAGEAAARAEWYGDRTALDLDVLDDLDAHRLARHFAGVAADHERIAQALAEDAQLKRPLFAALTGLAVRDRRPGRLDPVSVTRHFLERYKRRWEERRRGRRCDGIERRLLAVATIAGGCPRKILRDLELEAEGKDLAALRDYCSLMTGTETTTEFAKLEPDYVGGLFVLMQIEQPDSAEDDEPNCAEAARLMRLAWHYGDAGEFLVNLTRNFAGDSDYRVRIVALARQAPSLPEQLPRWGDALSDVVLALAQRGADDQANQILAVLEDHADADVLRPFLAHAIFGAGAAGELGIHPRRQACLDRLRALAEAHPSDAAVRKWLVKTLVNVISRDVARAKGLLDELRAVANLHPDDPDALDCLALGIYNATARAGPRAKQTETSLGELRVLARDHPTNAKARMYLATALANAIGHLGADATRVETLLDEMRVMASAYPRDPAVREKLVTGLGNAIAHCGPNTARAETLLAELRAIAGAHPADPIVQIHLAIGLNNAMALTAPNDARAKALLGELRGMARAHPSHIAVRELLARVLLFNAVKNAGHDSALTVALRSELHALTKAYPDGAALRAGIAGLFFDALQDGEQDATRALTLFSELRALTKAHPDDTVLRGCLAMSLANSVMHAGPDAARAAKPLAELCTLVEAHPGDTGIRQALASGFVNAIYCARQNPARAEVMLRELRGLATAHPYDATVRERLARGLTTMIADAGPDATRMGSLLVELRALAEAYAGDAAIRENLAMSLFNAVNNARSAQAEILFGELRLFAEAHPSDAAVGACFARTLRNAISDARQDTARAKTLFDELHGLAEIHAGNSAIREHLAASLSDAFNNAHKDTTRADALLAELRALAEAHPSDTAVWLCFASCLKSSITYAGRDNARVQARLGELRALAKVYAGDPDVRKQFAEGINSAIRNVSSDTVRVAALIEELSIFVKAHPEDEKIQDILVKMLLRGN
jgi:hypothetical protein